MIIMIIMIIIIISRKVDNRWRQHLPDYTLMAVTINLGVKQRVQKTSQCAAAFAGVKLLRYS
jgi:hypothetical protein